MKLKAHDLRELTVDELKQKHRDLLEELFNLRFQHATSQLENVMRIPEVRRDIARVNTVIGEKERTSA
jgi:large subunit ribosomal protein L29